MKKSIIGWREWVSLPDLNIAKIKAKIDTGARTSTLHALDIAPFTKAGEMWIRFSVHPVQDDDATAVQCEAKVFERRIITNSGGGQEERYVIKTPLYIGDSNWLIELTLTNRAGLGFRMLIGRTALKGRVIVDPAVSYRASRANRQAEFDYPSSATSDAVPRSG